MRIKFNRVPKLMPALLAAALVPVWGANTPKPVEDTDAAPKFAERNPRYRVALSDELEISFRFTPEFNQKVMVQPDGFISLQDVGDLKAVGLTVVAVRDAIAEKYSSILNDPVVSVKLANFNKPYFIVGGKVMKPGQFELRGPLTMTDAIAIAGGFSNGAHTKHVMLFRRVSSELVEVKQVDLKAALHTRPEEDIALRPGDSIFVPMSAVGKIERFMDISRMGLYFPLPVPWGR